MISEVNEQEMKKRAYDGQKQTAGLVGATTGNYQNECAGNPSLTYRLERRVQDGFAQSDNANRALRILQAHPEFEDFLWLLRSGLV